MPVAGVTSRAYTACIPPGVRCVCMGSRAKRSLQTGLRWVNVTRHRCIALVARIQRIVPSRGGDQPSARAARPVALLSSATPSPEFISPAAVTEVWRPGICLPVMRVTRSAHRYMLGAGLFRLRPTQFGFARPLRRLGGEHHGVSQDARSSHEFQLIRWVAVPRWQYPSKGGGRRRDKLRSRRVSALRRSAKTFGGQR